MEKQEISVNVGFQLKGIEVLDFIMNSNSGKIKSVLTYHTNINIEHRINQDKKIIIVIPTAEIIHDDNKTLLAKTKVSFIFELDSFDNFKTEKEVIFKIPKDLIISLNSISVSTLRGIMFTLFRGTYLHKAILPIVDPRSFVPAIDQT